MVFTTKIKLILKRYSPQWLFSIIRFCAEHTILKLIALSFAYQTKGFKERRIKHVSYGKGKSFDIIIDPKNGYLDAQVFAKKLYEPHIVEEFVRNISPGAICIDIGANIGHHSIIMAQSAGETGKVYAYEPIPYIREQMEESLALNHITNVITISDALSKEPGEMTLRLNKDSIASSSFFGEESSDGIRVSVKTLDSYNYEHVSFMKIDVEGFEYNVLLGAEKLIAISKPRILFEFSPIYYRAHRKEDVHDILAFFRNHNYVMYDLEDDRKEIHTLEDFIEGFNEGLRSQTNILAIPR